MEWDWVYKVEWSFKLHSGTRSKLFHSISVLRSTFSPTIDNSCTFIQCTITKIWTSSILFDRFWFPQHVQANKRIYEFATSRLEEIEFFSFYRDFYVTVRYNKKSVYMLHRKFWHFFLYFLIDFYWMVYSSWNRFSFVWFLNKVLAYWIKLKPHNIFEREYILSESKITTT